jgi:hypothetical protein
MFLAAQQGLSRQIVATFSQGELGATLPIGALVALILYLPPQFPLVGYRNGNLLLGLRQLRPHIVDDLVKHFFGILCPSDEVV